MSKGMFFFEKALGKNTKFFTAKMVDEVTVDDVSKIEPVVEPEASESEGGAKINDEQNSELPETPIDGNDPDSVATPEGAEENTANGELDETIAEEQEPTYHEVTALKQELITLFKIRDNINKFGKYTEAMQAFTNSDFQISQMMGYGKRAIDAKEFKSGLGKIVAKTRKYFK